ncbi:hypothetical protein BJF83_07920 [Nocardiopsis sp. CNR-923]|uniref:SWIM zinc finger family protein n=1 Tax=Nocardiopsis sp. CNR-923 TaxID=1904965 RepID=UPI000958E7ED|nr:hypothetical protein [Nocardiopsis sp. CNR-923]OLT30627.1 hypothetical protein BJF83_07920 [Nocardiopsis sp. CNR-923]
MSQTWSALVGAALGVSADDAGDAVERVAVRPGEVLARVGGVHETSLIRPVLSDGDWDRACAALASQPVFRARLLAGELPPATARVFGLLGLALAPRGWADVVATCSCDGWEGRCSHLSATASALAREADRDPFTLARWAGRERRDLMERVAAFSVQGNGAAPDREVEQNAPAGARGTEWIPLSENGREAAAVSATAFWSAPEPPAPPRFAPSVGARVRAAAPGAIADELPLFARGKDARAKGE